CTTFDSLDQLVDIRPSSNHDYRGPRSTDKRGLCPSLNAAANHGFLHRYDTTTIEQVSLFLTKMSTGLYAAYGMSPELATTLAAIEFLFLRIRLP
ncbi:hypothetical protein K505DRAFT_233168, partial [Melanomma pulvis-pyrius CBS 109.77]